MILTYKYRIKDRSARKTLRRHAVAVNQVWNYCVGYQRDIAARYWAGAKARRWPSAFDLCRLTMGTSQALGIHSGTINSVCWTFCNSRRSARRAPRFRVSDGPRRSLGWVPFRATDRRLSGNIIRYFGKDYRFWLGGRPLPDIVKSGAFVEDALGRWYVCLAVEVEITPSCGAGQIGIDLGLSRLATGSDGRVIKAPKYFQRYAPKLAAAQRAGKKKRAAAIHARIKNCRRDFIHKATTRLIQENQLIVIGNITTANLSRRGLVKSAMDAGWSMFRSQLAYKTASRRQAAYVIIDESFTTQTCSSCGVIPDSSPKGMGALGMRAWKCSSCGDIHDRDVNAAKNILRLALSAQRRDDGSRKTAQAVDRISTTRSPAFEWQP